MTSNKKILAMIERVQRHVDAMDSLTAGMVAGLKMGSVDPDHIELLVAALSDTIRQQVAEIQAALVASGE
ncbi:hypothetical protein AB4076_20430 [Dyella sp. 2RAF44]|uniref:hypothetical protein n=1 Tax=Dyella sp. 2RAF44 TaxID=3233000 RepID=UPI003F906CD8